MSAYTHIAITAAGSGTGIIEAPEGGEAET